MKAVRYFIYELKFKYKLMFLFSVLVLVPLIIMAFYFQVFFVQRLEKNTMEMETAIALQIKGNIEAYTSRVSTLADSVTQQEIFQEALQMTQAEFDEYLEEKSDTWNTWIEGVRSGIDGELIQNLRIYLPEDHLILQEGDQEDSFFENIESVRTSLWYGVLSTTDRTSLTAAAFYLNSWEIQNFGTLGYIKKIPYYTEGERNYAYVVVYYDRNFLARIMNTYRDYDRSMLYIIDEKNSIIEYSGEDVMNWQLLDYNELEAYDSAQEGVFASVDRGTQDIWTLYEEIPLTGWKLVMMISKDSITQETRRDSIKFMAIYLAAAVLVLLLISYFARMLAKRLTRLQNQMQMTKGGPPDRLPGPVHGDEIGVLTQEYNAMTDQIHRLMTEKMDLQKEKNTLEMNMLRAQINPHFLYNTLDMISWYAIKGKMQDVTDTVQLLAKFYRLSLNSGKLITTLENELLLTEKYVELQNRRSRCQIEFITDIPDEMLEQKIPQLLLQPLVENSLKHGIYEKAEPEGILTILGWMEEEWMVLILSDDGVGIDGEMASQLMLGETSSDPKEKQGHIGIQNIYRRLRLFYGEDGFSMRYLNSEEGGTQVELRLSVKSGKEEEWE